MKKQKLRDFNDLVTEELRDPKFAAAYLNEHLAYEGPKARQLLLQALQNIAKAQGLSALSKQSGISRRTLYYAFSKAGNPTLDTFFALLKSIGVGIQFNSLGRPKVA
ncbi:MAG TPA: addiction module antidote protein [Bdellovibrionota bacterium]|nr:addiction module antidote protein [Bdellovibrionota bacterium]